HDKTAPLFAALLSLPLPERRYPPLGLTPQQQKQHTLDALAAWLVEETEYKPVLTTWEDLQWPIPSTLRCLGLIIDQTPTVRMLNVLTFRPEFVPPWPARSHLTPLTLNRLERPQVEAIITQLTGGKVLPKELVQHVVSKTDGVPLFVEEFTKMVLEAGILKKGDGRDGMNGPPSPATIPSTLQKSVMARVDRVAPGGGVAALGGGVRGRVGG